MVVSRRNPIWVLCALLISSLIWVLPAGGARGQEAQPDIPVYIIQSGDSLWDIAQRFGVELDDLTQVNNITDPNQLVAGDQLVIPGLEGVQGVLTTRSLPYGETLRSLSRRYGISEEMLARMNHIANPSQLYVGYNLIIPEESAIDAGFERIMIMPGQSLLELAVLNDVNSWQIVAINEMTGTVTATPGDPLFLLNQAHDGPGGLPGEIGAVEINPLPMLQGKASVVQIDAQPDLQITGSFMGHELLFFEAEPGRYVAIQGVHAMAEPGLYPLVLHNTAATSGQPHFTFSQQVYVGAVDYPYDRPLKVNPTTIDPAVTRPEDAQWTALAAPVTPVKMWDGVFQLPSPLSADYCLETNECWSSRFGNRRSYNGSPYTAFHTGLDIVGGSGTKIFAPAAGTVVFAGPLTVRGNATMIDHGWGIYSAYMHQSELLVEVGDQVEPGQLIGIVGGTGRVEGPHLHWEVWAGGVQVDPLDWLEFTYP